MNTFWTYQFYQQLENVISIGCIIVVVLCAYQVSEDRTNNISGLLVVSYGFGGGNRRV
jgi:hypothetical protein